MTIKLNVPAVVKQRLQEHYDTPARSKPWDKELVYSSDLHRTRGSEEVNAAHDNGGGCVYDNHPRECTMHYPNTSENAMVEPYFPMDVISGKKQYHVNPTDNLQTGEHEDLFYQEVTDKEGTTGFLERQAVLDRY